MNGVRDVLERLLPEADADVARRARRMTTFLRLLHTEARSRPAASVGVNLQRARAELDRARRTAAAGVLADLASLHLEAALGAASFVSVPRARLPPRRAWARLEELRASGLELPQVSAPDEPSADVAARMVAGLERLGGAPGAAQRLAAVCERARGGAAAGERAFERLHRSAAAPALRAAARVGQVEAALDRGQVARAAALLAACAEGAAGAGAGTGAAEEEPFLRLAVLGRWVALLSGSAPEPTAGLPGELAALPTPLIELRRRRPEWSPHLRGPARRGNRPPTLEPVAWSGARDEHGALVLAVFTVGPRGRVELLEADVGPGLAPRVAAWSTGARPERAALAAARPWVRHRAGAPTIGAPLTGALSPRTVSLAAWPVGAEEAAASCDWIWLEFEHHLVPTRRRLQALARSWSARRAAVGSEPLPRGGGADGTPATLRATIEELVAGLAVKTRERRWWGIDLAPGGPRVAASGGRAPAQGPRALAAAGPLAGRALAGRALAGRALNRALRFREVLRSEGAPDLFLDPRSVCGLVVPAVSRGTLLGALAFESERRGDFGAAWVARVAARVRAGADRWRLARFRDWHRARRGRDVLFGLEDPPAAELFEAVLGAAGAQGPVAVSGPAGAGKTVVASWVHFERAPADAPFELFAGAAGTTWASLRRALERSTGGTLCVEGLERLPERNLARLLASSARLVVTCEGRSLRAAAQAGALPPGVARVLERDEVIVPTLAERRLEVPGLARLFVDQAVLELGLAPVEIGEAAAAWLWRQPWRENLRQLETLLYRCVQALAPAAGAGPARLEADLLERIARQQGGPSEGQARVPPRAATAQIVRAALEATRTAGGAFHRGRAALYLGWHPDTLARRARALGLEA